jgi:Holliday junction DNA helicase RuvB
MSRPVPSLFGFVGQGHILPGLKRIAEGAKDRGEAFPHTLFGGNSGLGKTFLGRVLALLFGTTLHVLLCRRDLDELAIGLAARDWASGDIVALDETHALPPYIQELLYGTMENGVVPEATQDASQEWTVNGQRTIPKLTIVAATDQPGKLLPAFRKRFVLNYMLRPYTLREMKVIVRQRASEKQMLLTRQAISVLGKASRSLPRRAGHLLDTLAMYHGAQNPAEYTKVHVAKCLRSVGVDDNGLTTLDRAYVKFLAECGTRGASLRVLEAKLQCDAGYLVKEVESYLIQLGFLTIGPAGRVLTEAGISYAQGM